MKQGSSLEDLPMSNNPQQGSQHGQGTHKDNPGSGQHQQQQDQQKSGQQGTMPKPGHVDTTRK